VIIHSVENRKNMIERKSEEISIKKQCELLSIQRSGLYYEPKGENLQNLILMESKIQVINATF
jgi:hypothetical protein